MFLRWNHTTSVLLLMVCSKYCCRSQLNTNNTIATTMPHVCSLLTNNTTFLTGYEEPTSPHDTYDLSPLPDIILDELKPLKTDIKTTSEGLKPTSDSVGSDLNP